jgi:lactate dehydrogenase-like 2-hydroxyacid dehydrogenase
MGFNVFVTREIPQAGLDIVYANCDPVEMNPDDQVLSREALLAGVRGRDGVLCLLTDRIDDEVFAAAGPQCKVFANYAVGFNNVDLDAATKHGKLVTNTPGVLTDATADHTWTLLMATARRISEADAYMRTGAWGGWGPMQFLGGDVTGRTLGIIGAGRIGTAVAQRSAGFDMKVLYHDQRRNEELERKLGAMQVSKEELLAESDFVSLHVDLNESTRHLISTAELKRMKPTAYLINTSRGPVIDETALVQALQENQIAGAGLDVFEDEPKAKDGLFACKNTVLVPHIASATHWTRSQMAILAANNLVAALKGEKPPNLVNPDVWAG